MSSSSFLAWAGAEKDQQSSDLPGYRQGGPRVTVTLLAVFVEVNLVEAFIVNGLDQFRAWNGLLQTQVHYVSGYGTGR